MRARRGARLSRAAAIAACVSAVSCESVPRPDLERMIDQAKFEENEATDLFPDGRASRPPPRGAVAADAVAGDPLLETGMEQGRPTPRIPIPVTLALLRRGRDRFDVFCAPCHGVRGDGQSVVAETMELRKPPSLLHPASRDMPSGRIYQAVAFGYGLMRPYAGELPTMDRWAVVSYVRALQRSQGVPLAELPEPLRHRALQELP